MDLTDNFVFIDYSGSICGSSYGLLSVAGLCLYSSGNIVNK